MANAEEAGGLPEASSAADAATLRAATCFGRPLDEYARHAGGWPPEAVVYGVEVVNDAGQIKLIGGRPTGLRKDNLRRPTFAKKAEVFQAFCSIEQYRTHGCPSPRRHIT